MDSWEGLKKNLKRACIGCSLTLAWDLIKYRTNSEKMAIAVERDATKITQVMRSSQFSKAETSTKY